MGKRLQVVRRTGLVASVVLFAMLGSIANASPGEAKDYNFPANTLSPQFKVGNCLHKIRYGNYGNVAYAQVRMYTVACDGVDISVIAQRGSEWTLFGRDGSTGGTDGCGRYSEAQATSPADYIGIGMSLGFPEVNERYLFRHDVGRPPAVHREC